MIKRILFVTSVVLCCFLSIQCDEDDDNIPTKGICDQTTIVKKEIYDSLVSADFTFVDAEVKGDCLTIEISASGCDGNTWKFNLVDSGAVAESSPEQRYLKFQLINEEACLAVFKRIVSFDLTPLQISGSNEIILNLEGLESSLRYKY
ncbi:hypothetical protein Q4Q39_13880 [Flavivirga amylovorans]|uniref:Lipocalin-like domain-containing protein n=1 Tax=Flavivirga amylovorans TaxID=870486 RepID=A0ABT8X3I0_9FLAO|nr:hypothetical protein [Flavivirga amylovorans]MDO5988498.1 hypothetical protein [Flavivirga amylovorans]